MDTILKNDQQSGDTDQISQWKEESKQNPGVECTYCPKCTARLTLIDNRYDCHKCGFCFYINPVPATALILVNEAGDILLAKRERAPHKGYWELPGGIIEFHESAEEGMRREIQEELGLELGEMIYLGSYPNEYYYKTVLYRPLDFVFIAYTKDRNIQATQEEFSIISFFSPDSIPFDQFAFISNKNALQDFISARNENRK